jgi:hypothetical protein
MIQNSSGRLEATQACLLFQHALGQEVARPEFFRRQVCKLACPWQRAGKPALGTKKNPHSRQTVNGQRTKRLLALAVVQGINPGQVLLKDAKAVRQLVFGPVHL